MADGLHTVDGARECQRLRSKSAALEGRLFSRTATHGNVPPYAIAHVRRYEIQDCFRDVAGSHHPQYIAVGTAHRAAKCVQHCDGWGMLDLRLKLMQHLLLAPSVLEVDLPRLAQLSSI
jgi:hypothetical protein